MRNVIAAAILGGSVILAAVIVSAEPTQPSVDLLAPRGVTPPDTCQPGWTIVQPMYGPVECKLVVTVEP